MKLKTSWIPITFVLSLTIIGAIIRLYQLDWQCLMVDEWHTWEFISSNTFIDSVISSITQPNNSLYYPFAKLSSVLLGAISIYSIRLPSAIYGILIIPVSYFIGKEYNNKITGVLLSGFIALSFPFIYYSQNARSYMAVLLTFLIFMYFLIKVLRGDTHLKNMIGLAISAILCLYAHQYALIPICVSFIFVLYYKGRELWKYILAAILVTAPAIYYNRNYIPVLFGSNSPPDYASPFWLTWDKLAIMIPSELFGTIWIIIVILLVYSLYKKRGVISISFTTIAIVSILSCLPMTLVLAMSPRYVLLVAPMIFLVAIDPISNFIKTYTSDWQKSALILICLLCFWVCAYGSWLSWTTFNYCAYV